MWQIVLQHAEALFTLVLAQAGAIALIQTLIQLPTSAHLGCFMASKVANVANLRSEELIRRRLAEHPYFFPAWLAQIGAYADASAPALPAVDYLPGHAHPSPEYSHLLCLVQGLGGRTETGIMFSGTKSSAQACPCAFMTVQEILSTVFKLALCSH